MKHWTYNVLNRIAKMNRYKLINRLCRLNIESNNLLILNKISNAVPTRPSSITIIDHVISSPRNEKYFLSNIEDNISDHNIIMLELKRIGT